MKTKLDYLSQRQALIAQNIANADTPHYKAQDLTPPDFSKMVNANGSPASSLHLMTTHGNHITPTTSGSGDFKQINRASTSELNPDGNNVSIEDETAQMGMNQGEYQKVLNLYSAALTMFKTAIDTSNTGG